MATTKTITVTITKTIVEPSDVKELQFNFYQTAAGVWRVTLVGAQGAIDYPVAANVTGAEATALVSVASKFLTKYVTDANAGLVG